MLHTEDSAWMLDIGASLHINKDVSHMSNVIAYTGYDGVVIGDVGMLSIPILGLHIYLLIIINI